MLKADCMLMASVQSLGPDSFMVAESISQPSGQPKEVVALYDAERSVASGQLAPLASFSEHVDIVTCMAGSASNPNICFTGSKDALIKLWDKRQVGRTGWWWWWCGCGDGWCWWELRWWGDGVGWRIARWKCRLVLC
jgi:hypothetical protein